MVSLDQRLKILENSGLISFETKIVVGNVIKIFNEKYGIILDEDNGAMMTTHLAMAITRIKNGEPVKKISEEVYEEVLESQNLKKAEKIYEDLEKVFDVELPEEEKKYMLVNICVILEN